MRCLRVSAIVAAVLLTSCSDLPKDANMRVMMTGGRLALINRTDKTIYYHAADGDFAARENFPIICSIDPFAPQLPPDCGAPHLAPATMVYLSPDSIAGYGSGTREVSVAQWRFERMADSSWLRVMLPGVLVRIR